MGTAKEEKTRTGTTVDPGKELTTMEIANLKLVEVESFESLAGEGVDFGVEDLKVPFLNILQALSPQIKRSDPNFDEAAQEGMIHNTLTEELYDGEEGIAIIPCVYRKITLEWRDRSIGGGLVGSRPFDRQEYAAAARTEKGAFLLANGNIIEETAEYYVLQVSENGQTDPAIIAMSRSMLNSSRTFNALLAKTKIAKKDGSGFFTPPIYAHLIRMKTIAYKKKEHSWFVWKAITQGFANQELIGIAREFRASVLSGKVDVVPKPSDDFEGDLQG